MKNKIKQLMEPVIRVSRIGHSRGFKGSCLGNSDDCNCEYSTSGVKSLNYIFISARRDLIAKFGGRPPSNKYNLFGLGEEK